MKKIGNRAFLLGMVFLLFSFGAQAETSVSAVADRQQMGLGDAFTIVVTVESDEDFEAQLPQLPRVNGLEEINSVVGGRQSSSSMAIINGKTQFRSQTTQQYQYVMSPQKEGTFIIPSIDVAVNGHTYKTQPFKIEVGEQFRNGSAQRQGANPPKGRPRFPPGFGDDDDATDPFGGAGSQAEDLFDQLLQQQQRMFGNRGLPGGLGLPRGQIPSKKLDAVNVQKDNFFVYLDTDKTEVYEGEQVTANWYIYTRANIESLDRVKFPDLKGFWKEIIEEVPSLQFTDEIVNGVHYKKALLASHALFPIKAGTAVIDEFKIKAKVRNSGYSGSLYDITKVSKRTPIKVLPLPEEGKTVSFSGAVGQYRVTAKTDGTSFPANQPFSIKIRYEGLGNAKLIDLPQIKWPDGLEVYDSKSDAKFFKEGNSYKEFEILVIPRKEGELKIPALELTYFDPASKKYISQSTDEITLQIAPGNSQPVPPSSSGAAVNPSQPDAQVALQPILQLPEAGLSLAPYRLSIYAALLLIGFVLILLRSLRSVGQLNFESENLRLIQVKQKSVEKFAQTQDWRKVGSEATNLIYLIVAQLAGQKKADQELHLLIQEIPAKDQQKYLDQINGLFDYFQLLGFSPDEIMKNVVKQNLMQQQIQNLKQLSKEIVDKIRKEDKNNS